MAVQKHSAAKTKKSVSLGNIEFKFNSEDGYFVESNYNRAFAMKCPDLTDVLKDIADYGRKQFENMFRKMDEKIKENKEDNKS